MIQFRFVIPSEEDHTRARVMFAVEEPVFGFPLWQTKSSFLHALGDQET
jgi:hypothetical protein